MHRVLTVGESLVLLVNEEPGLLRHARSLGLRIGGAESNVAIGLQRLGIAARWASRVGADSFGDLILTTLRSEGLDVRATVDPSRPSAVMLKEHRTPHSQQITYFRAGSAGTALTEEDLPPALLDGVGVVHTTGITAGLSDGTADAVARLLDRARSAGLVTSFDVNFRRRIWGTRDPRASLAALAGRADVIFASLDEASLLCDAGGPEDTALAIASTFGAREVIVKMGALGSVAVADGAVHRQPAVPVPAVDTIGAGDAFVAGYLSELVRGAPVPKRLQRGAECGAFVCLTVGDWEGAARLEDIPLLHATEEATR
jgi:2-dehydro-3-deoxygluconokinase